MGIWERVKSVNIFQFFKKTWFFSALNHQNVQWGELTGRGSGSGRGIIFGFFASAAPKSSAARSFFFLPASTIAKKAELATRQAKTRAKAVLNFMMMMTLFRLTCWLLLMKKGKVCTSLFYLCELISLLYTKFTLSLWVNRHRRKATKGDGNCQSIMHTCSSPFTVHWTVRLSVHGWMVSR